MWTNWFPWRFIISKLAKKHGFIDPIKLVSSLNRISQPAEVAAPVELLRLSAVLHARGLINSQVIQNNLDWIWPYWVQQQFNPGSSSFVPRAFSLTHINLTHRNWTAVGLPGSAEMPIVDPRGLVTPLYDGWSLDFWLVGRDGYKLFPSKAEKADQKLEMLDNISVMTDIVDDNNFITSRVEVKDGRDSLDCALSVTGSMEGEGYLVVSLRPFNPEGISFVHEVKGTPSGWEVNGKDNIFFQAAPREQAFSNYRRGDVADEILSSKIDGEIKCDVGLCTAAALFKLDPGKERQVKVVVPLKKNNKKRRAAQRVKWPDAVSRVPGLKMPDNKIKYLFDASVRTLVLMSPDEVLAGPYTYKEFWFRDAVFAANAILALNMHDKAKEVIDGFLKYQLPSGYFKSQDGEWDSNGQVLWIMKKYCELSGRSPDKAWIKPVISALNWMVRKRQTRLDPEDIRYGLFPAGFSAEHFGPNDHYYWDDFWGIAGFEAGIYLLESSGKKSICRRFRLDRDSFLRAVDASIDKVRKERGSSSFPSSPFRRMDSSAVGNMVAGYPLGIYDPGDSRVRETAEYLMKHDLVKGLFFHEIAHSGINVYLSLHIAQVLLRCGDARFLDMVSRVADMASGTGQWPEAIHPWTGGGCMGDGQHLWASSEWIMMVRNCFVREEGNTLILCSGIPEKWIDGEEKMCFGPAPTSFGEISITISRPENVLKVDIDADPRGNAPNVEIRMPGYERVILDPGDRSATLRKVQ